MAHYEQSHLDLHFLQRYKYWSDGMKRLINCDPAADKNLSNNCSMYVALMLSSEDNILKYSYFFPENRI